MKAYVTLAAVVLRYSGMHAEELESPRPDAFDISISIAVLHLGIFVTAVVYGEKPPARSRTHERLSNTLVASPDPLSRPTYFKDWTRLHKLTPRLEIAYNSTQGPVPRKPWHGRDYVVHKT